MLTQDQKEIKALEEQVKALELALQHALGECRYYRERVEELRAQLQFLGGEVI